LKIAISADRPDLKAKVGGRFGTSQYLVIVDLETMAFEAAPNPGASGQSGAGMQAVVLAISKEVNTILTGYISPTARKYLSTNGIEVLTGIDGTVADVVDEYKKSVLHKHIGVELEQGTDEARIDKASLVQALRSSCKQFVNLLPILTGVVLLIGLFNAFMPRELLSSIFSENIALDTFWGHVSAVFLPETPSTVTSSGESCWNTG